MDRNTEATLRRKNMQAESDKVTTNERIEDLVRQFMILPKETRREYSVAVGGKGIYNAERLSFWISVGTAMGCIALVAYGT